MTAAATTGLAKPNYTEAMRPRAFLAATCVLWLPLAGTAQEWVSLGPTGGDVRSLAADPRDPSVVYLGTSHGTLYRSEDAGERWQRLDPGFPLPGHSLDDLLVAEDGTLYVGFWEVAGAGGGVARSEDGGQTFTLLPEIAGRPVRALSLVPGTSDSLVAGRPDGVLRSDDRGRTWRRLSPEGHEGLRDVNSVAVDPQAAGTVYAGTWHLPWKTTDGGDSWTRIHSGMIDDSDVMTLTLDPRERLHVTATACSGIYRSRDGGRSWRKLPGIPDSARRTRAFAQDPGDPGRLFAGTTEGLWLSEDDAASWRLVTTRQVVLNAVVVLPGGVVLAGSDAAGVLRSTDRGSTFRTANAGFAERFVSRVAFDANGGIVAALLGDRHHSGVVARRPGEAWRQLAPGLEGREVLSLDVGDALLVGTDAGLFAWEGDQGWRPLPVSIDGSLRTPRVADVLVVGASGSQSYLAASDEGLLTSHDAGRNWRRTQLGLARAVEALVGLGPRATLAATRLGLFRSDDAGETWSEVGPGPGPAIRLLATRPGSDLLAGTERGIFRSPDGGASWLPTDMLPTAITGLAIHPDGHTVLAADFSHQGLFVSTDGGRSFSAHSTRGLASGRVWSVVVSPHPPHEVVVSSPVGGLHRLEQRQAAREGAEGFSETGPR